MRSKKKLSEREQVASDIAHNSEGFENQVRLGNYGTASVYLSALISNISDKLDIVLDKLEQI